MLLFAGQQLVCKTTSLPVFLADKMLTEMDMSEYVKSKWQGFVQDFIPGGVSKNQGVTHRYTRHLLTYFNAAEYI